MNECMHASQTARPPFANEIRNHPPAWMQEYITNRPPFANDIRNHRAGGGSEWCWNRTPKGRRVLVGFGVQVPIAHVFSLTAAWSRPSVSSEHKKNSTPALSCKRTQFPCGLIHLLGGQFRAADLRPLDAPHSSPQDLVFQQRV